MFPCPRFGIRLNSLLAAHLLLAPSASIARNVKDLQQEALQAMRAKEWGKAQASLQVAVDQYDGVAPSLYGQKFGWFWYHKGYCEMKLKRWTEAAKSFAHAWGYFFLVAGGTGLSFCLLAMLRFLAASAALALDCFCAWFFCFDFGDLSPMVFGGSVLI